jgi:hypothetical protein
LSKAKSAFGRWFTAQFGARPFANRSHTQLLNAVTDARYVLRQAEVRLDLRERYEASERAALYAWQAAAPHAEKDGTR